MLGRAELETGLWAVRAREREPVPSEPHDGELVLDRAVDIPTSWFAAHAIIVPNGATNDRLVGPLTATPGSLRGAPHARCVLRASRALQRLDRQDRPFDRVLKAQDALSAADLRASRSV